MRRKWKRRHFVSGPISRYGDLKAAQPAQSEALAAEYAKLGMMIRNLWKEWRKL